MKSGIFQHFSAPPLLMMYAVPIRARRPGHRSSTDRDLWNVVQTSNKKTLLLLYRYAPVSNPDRISQILTNFRRGDIMQLAIAAIAIGSHLDRDSIVARVPTLTPAQAKNGINLLDPYISTAFTLNYCTAYNGRKKSDFFFIPCFILRDQISFFL